MAKKVLLGSSAGGTGVLTVSATGTLTSEQFAAGVLFLNGGSVGVDPPAVPDDPVLDGSLVAGYLRDGSVTVNGGVLTTAKLKLGVTAGKTGVFALNGGVLSVNTLGVGNDATPTGGAGVGIADINGGQVNVLSVVIGSSAGGTGQMTLAAGSDALLKTSSLSIASGGANKLDLTDNKLVVTAASLGSWDGSAYTGVTGLVQRGRNGGTWNGSGIGTSMGDAASGLTALAIATAGDAGYGATRPFGGLSVATSAVLVMYTYGGDANLDGKLNGDDYFRVDSNVGVAGASGWSNGDFDYDGEIDGDDYFILDRNMGRQTVAMFAAAGGAVTTGRATAAVPEPHALALLLPIACHLASRRRRQRASQIAT